MISLDRYKQLLALTNFQYEQARQLIEDLVDQGILLPIVDDFTAPKQTFFDSHDSYNSRKELYSVLRFRQRSLAFELEYQLASLLSELDEKLEITQPLYERVTQLLAETKPYIMQHYLKYGITEAELQATDFNLVLLYHVRTSLHGWVISAAEFARVRSTDQSESDLFIDMFKEHVLADS